MVCLHQENDKVIEPVVGLKVLKCNDCKNIFIDGALDVDRTTLITYLHEAIEKAHQYEDRIMDYLKQYTPPDRFSEIFTPLNGKNKWWKIQHSGGKDYLVVYFKDDSLKKSDNVKGATVRSLGRLDRFLDIDEFFGWRDSCAAWKLVAKYIQDRLI